jgi:hypothetical protein
MYMTQKQLMSSTFFYYRWAIATFAKLMQDFFAKLNPLNLNQINVCAIVMINTNGTRLMIIHNN